MYRKIGKKAGFALIYAVFLIVILSFLGALLVSILSSTSKVASENLLYSQALYCAEAGKEIAIMKCIQGTCTNGTYKLGDNTITVKYISSSPLPDNRTLYTATSQCNIGIANISRKIEFKFWK